MFGAEQVPHKSPLCIICAVLGLIALACNIPRSVVANDDFACEAAGGRWVIDEQGSRCEMEPSTEELSSPGDPEQSLIPAGTYQGAIIETQIATGGLVPWLVQGTVVSNEIILTIAADGSVTGQFLYEKTGNILVSDDGGGAHAPCIDSNDQFFVGQASGQLTGSSGRIVFAIQQTIVGRLTEGCSIGPKETTLVREYRQQFEIEIQDGELLGTSVASVEDGHPIKATFLLARQ